MNRDFIESIKEIEETKGISKETIFEALEVALASAYKKNYATDQDVYVDLDKETGETNIFTRFEVVEEVEDEATQISLAEAQAVDQEYEIGDYVEYVVNPKDFGRIAAMTARQVVLQKLREAERNIVFDEYIKYVGNIVTGRIHRVVRDTVFISLDETDGVLVEREQVPGEAYYVGDLIKVYLMDVRKMPKGSQLYFSRSHPSFIGALFATEVPEIEEGLVEIKSIARDAGLRTKIAVNSIDRNVDPVGACVGANGDRVQAVINELQNEKIDIVEWSEDPFEFIINSLKPAVVTEAFVDVEERRAFVVVPNNQLSLAIGRSGQNVRLAAKLTDFRIDIKTEAQVEVLEAAGEFNRENPFYVENKNDPREESETDTMKELEPETSEEVEELE